MSTEAFPFAFLEYHLSLIFNVAFYDKVVFFILQKFRNAVRFSSSYTTTGSLRFVLPALQGDHAQGYQGGEHAGLPQDGESEADRFWNREGYAEPGAG